MICAACASAQPVMEPAGPHIGSTKRDFHHALFFNSVKALVASAAILASIHTAHAQFATEFTQLLNNVQLVQHGAEQLKQSAQFAQQITNQVQQIQNQLQMYQNMLQNTATLPTGSGVRG